MRSGGVSKTDNHIYVYLRVSTDKQDIISQINEDTIIAINNDYIHHPKIFYWMKV